MGSNLQNNIEFPDPSYQAIGIQAGDGSMPKKPHVDVSEIQEQQQVEEPKAITGMKNNISGIYGIFKYLNFSSSWT